MKNWVAYYEPGKYDLAVLHLDQQCVDDEIWRVGKGSVYRMLNEVITDIPKIVINHGTPYWPEKFETPYLIDFVEKAAQGNYMVVNSEQAGRMWGFGTPIIHGLDPDEWWDLPKEPRVVTMISPGGLPKYYDRALFDAVQERLAEMNITLVQISVDWVAKDWDDYRRFLGKSLVYFNPTRESPMPRSRTEAMLSGCCVVTTSNHDINKYIMNGYNGFLVPRSPERIAKMIEFLIRDFNLAVEVGQRGKATAQKYLHTARYQNDWKKFIDYVIDDYKKRKNNE